MTAAQWALNAAMSANPIGLVILAIVALVAIVVIAYKRSETFRNIVQAAFRAVLGAARALGSGAVAAFNALVAGGGRIISFFRALPGRIISFLASLPGRMLELGQGIIQRLIDGIMSRVAAVGNAIGSIAQKVRNFLPFSPAKEGPLSGSGDPFKAGQHISDMLAGGIASRRGGIGGAMGGALAPAGGGRGGGPGSGPLVLHINIGGRQLAEVLVDPLRKSIRTRGGDVQVVLGS
jgi:phage-related protein